MLMRVKLISDLLLHSFLLTHRARDRQGGCPGERGALLTVGLLPRTLVDLLDLIHHSFQCKSTLCDGLRAFADRPPPIWIFQ